jgi:uncharacterized membrane protein YvbJ
MFCPKCGAENLDEAKFCGSCGASMAIKKEEVASNFKDTQSTPQIVSQEMKVIMIIASIIIPLVGVIMGLIYMADPNPSKKAAGKIWLIVGIGASLVYCLLFASAGGCESTNYY